MAAGLAYRKILSVLLPAGTLGMTILLGSAAAQAAREAPVAEPATVAPPAGTAERLAAIRDAVSDLAGVADRLISPDRTEQVAWGNIGIGIGGIGVGVGTPWNNWNNGWKNWGNNWKNGWNNWSNGWNNY